MPSFSKTICGSVVFFFSKRTVEKRRKRFSDELCVCVLWTFVRVEKRCANDDDADELSVSHVRKERERERKRKGAEKPPQTLFITKRKKSRRRSSLSLSLHSSLTNTRTKKSEGELKNKNKKTRTDQSPVGHLHERRHVVIIPLSVKLYTICSFRARASRFVRLTVKKFFFLFSLFSREGVRPAVPAPSTLFDGVKTKNLRASRIKKKEVCARKNITTHPRARRFCVTFVATTTTTTNTQKKRDGFVIDER